MLSYEKIIIDLCNDCAKTAINTVQSLTDNGIFEPLYLYYKPSTEKFNGVLTLIPDSLPPPEGYELATGEGLRANIPFNEYFRWVKARVNRLPILAYGKP